MAHLLKFQVLIAFVLKEKNKTVNQTDIDVLIFYSHRKISYKIRLDEYVTIDIFHLIENVSSAQNKDVYTRQKKNNRHYNSDKK